MLCPFRRLAADTCHIPQSTVIRSGLAPLGQADKTGATKTKEQRDFFA
jgi:hypothetical protein